MSIVVDPRNRCARRKTKTVQIRWYEKKHLNMTRYHSNVITTASLPRATRRKVSMQDAPNREQPRLPAAGTSPASDHGVVRSERKNEDKKENKDDTFLGINIVIKLVKRRDSKTGRAITTCVEPFMDPCDRQRRRTWRRRRTSAATLTTRPP